MRRNLSILATIVFLMTVVFTANVAADNSDVNIPVSAEQAFDAVAKQVDPTTGESARVALLDLRTTAEYFWVGACGKVESILTTSGREFFPVDGKVILKWGRFLAFEIERGRRHRTVPVFLPLRDVEKVVTVDISIHVPTHTWDEAGCRNVPNPDFAASIESLSADYDVIILMCRSGKRSNTRAFDTSLFQAIYEIDAPDNSGNGGFQGGSYGDAYNGYRGFPGRDTGSKDVTSVSWADTGLPTHTGWTPFTIDVPATEPEPIPY